MRVASRIVGVALAFAGLAFLLVALLPLLFFRESVLVGSQDWKGPVFAVAALIGVGLLLLGRYYFRLDVNALDAPDPSTSRFAPYFLARRLELKFIAQVGLAISLIRLGALCFGVDWPGPWMTWPLAIAWIGLGIVAGQLARGQATD